MNINIMSNALGCCFTPVHVFGRQVQQPDHDAPPKLGIELGLIVDDVHKAFCEVELHMEVGEVGRNTASQTLQQKPARR